DNIYIMRMDATDYFLELSFTHIMSRVRSTPSYLNDIAYPCAGPSGKHQEFLSMRSIIRVIQIITNNKFPHGQSLYKPGHLNCTACGPDSNARFIQRRLLFSETRDVLAQR